jgi:hypothetical protein
VRPLAAQKSDRVSSEKKESVLPNRKINLPLLLTDGSDQVSLPRQIALPGRLLFDKTARQPYCDHNSSRRRSACPRRGSPPIGTTETRFAAGRNARDAVVSLASPLERGPRLATRVANRTFRVGIFPSYCNANDERSLLVIHLIVVPILFRGLFMSKENEDEVWLTAEPWKPSTVLKAAEDQAVKTAKFLHARKDQLARFSRKASVDDAIALAETILALARFGQKQPAAQAFQIMANVEIFMDQLAVEMDSLLTETK